jgi:hypothetical protein
VAVPLHHHLRLGRLGRAARGVIPVKRRIDA